MRKALFCVILVAASFAGGAVVNGPGLTWAKAMVMDRLGLVEGGEPRPPLPNDSIPPLAVEPSEVLPSVPGMRVNDVGPDRKDPFPNRSHPDILAKANGPDNDHIGSAASPQGNADKPKGLSAKKALTGSASPEPANPLDPDPLAEVKAKAKALPTLAPVPAADADAAPLPLPDPGASKSSGSSVDEPIKPLPTESTDAAVNPTARQPTASDGGAVEWAEIRRLLKVAGVSRYGIEGEPAGRVRFQCVIPVAGRRAMGQHFEAEGDDEIQAARAALKRIMLWRASGDQSDAR
jgi:hypothetical protein